jgi:hypothetical protein
MMFQPLYSYLIKHGQLDLAGIGVISLQTQPARSEFVDRSFLPPQQSFVFESGKEIPLRKLYSGIAAILAISEREAVIRLNDFLFELKKNIDAGREISWQGVGKFRRGLAGEIKFHADPISNFLEPVVAEKIIRKHAEHFVRVGEDEKTSTQMTELLLAEPERKQVQWWIWPVAAIMVCFIFLGWYFSEHDVQLSSTGNNHVIHPAEPPSGYSYLR